MARDRNELLRKLLPVPRRAVEKREELQLPTKSKEKVFGAFLDITEFTSTTNALIRSSQERGIGELVEHIEKEILIPAAKKALLHRGNIVSVEGDALLITFEKLGDVLGFCKEVSPHRRSTIVRPDQEFHLVLDIGIARGDLYEFVAGDSLNGRAYIAYGDALDQACRMEKRSKDGNIALNFNLPGVSKQIGGCPIIPEHDIPRIKIDRECRRSKREINRDLNRLVQDEGYLDSFVCANLPDDRSCHMDSPVIIFSNFPFIRLALTRLKPEEARVALNSFYLEAKKIVETDAEGYIDKFKDVGSLFFIGSPLSAKYPKKIAFKAVEELHSLHYKHCVDNGLPPLPSISGIHKGDALFGEIVGRVTGIGGALNRAYRIMADAASDDGAELEYEHSRVRFSRTMYDDRVARTVKSYPVHKRCLKGFDDDETVLEMGDDPDREFAFTTMVDYEIDNQEDILRREEYDKLLEIAKASIGWIGEGSIINVIGETGSGKDRLLSQVAQALQNEGYRTFEVRCQALYRKKPYKALFELMKDVCGVYSDEELLQEFIEKKKIESGTDLAKLLDGLKERLLERRSAYIINNGDNIDLESRDFFDSMSHDLVENGCFVAFSGSSKEEDPQRSRLFSSGQDLLIENLSYKRAKEFAETVAKEHFPGGTLHERELNRIIERSGGNPLFISETVKAMENRLGRLVIPKRLPETLKEIMLRNVQTSLPVKLQRSLTRYSLMHSVPLMAPIMDPEAKKNMHALAKQGFLTHDYEFPSSALKKALAEWMDPRTKQELCTSLAKAAEAAGMTDNLAIFEYLRNGRLTPENREKALEHAEKCVYETGFLYLVPEELFDEAIAVADKRFKAQRHKLGMLLNWKTSMLMAHYSDDRHPKKMERMETLLGLTKLSRHYLKGHKLEHKAVLQLARALSYLAYFEKLEQKDENEVKKKLKQSKALFELAREMTLEVGDIANYLGHTSNFSHSLINHHEDPEEALSMLIRTQSKMSIMLPKHVKDRGLLSRMALLYLVLADSALECKQYERAKEGIDMALELCESKELDYAEGVAYSLGMKAKYLMQTGQPWEAMDFAQQMLEMVRKGLTISSEFVNEIRKIVEDVERMKGGVSGEIN